MFNTADGANAAGLNYIRVPIGASDFSAGEYSLDDTSGDTSFNSFNINRAPSYLFSVLQDVKAINNNIKVHIVPWSPPAWMKTTDPTYLLKAVQGFQSKGIPIYAVSIQNEPQNSNPTYPTSTLTPAVEGQIGAALRTLLNNNGLSSVKHNWDNAGSYPITLQKMQDAGNSFAGVAFHCYAGSVSNQDTFHNAYPNKEIYFTECTGTYGSDWWADIKAFYAMAQASKAVYPKDAGGPFGQRIAVSVEGNLNWALRVGAFVTGRVSSSDWLRYSLVVLNWDDSASTSWNPVSVSATIAFRGAQASYTFPVGVTTLWWFAPATSATSAFTDGTTFTFVDDILRFDVTTCPQNATTEADNFTSGR
ncbi:hypothetical protein C0995_009606 [Termitomyces sp. Mi166|nr:hypothetical protein C0995_009606 [Termitomyces sp. Mi166\